MPRELTEVDAEDEIGECDATVLAYDGECPPAGSIICGVGKNGTAPDGSLLLRPYRKASTECA